MYNENNEFYYLNPFLNHSAFLLESKVIRMSVLAADVHLKAVIV